MRVRFHTTMRHVTGVREMDLPVADGEPLRVLLDQLFSVHPDLRPLVLDDTGKLRDSIAVLVNGRHARLLGGLEATLNDQDDIALMLPLGGG
jgi:molybdopterin synthase sulfur carrier subunit